MVLDSATALGLRSGPNPAQWKGHLALILPGRDRGSREHHAAMHYDDLPDFIRSLRALESVAARALEFTILTACRSGEVRFAVWPEINLDEKVWTIPASRMKAKYEHRVPLSDRAIEIVEQLALRRSGDVVFAGGAL
jgi:integrase